MRAMAIGSPHTVMRGPEYGCSTPERVRRGHGPTRRAAVGRSPGGDRRRGGIVAGRKIYLSGGMLSDGFLVYASTAERGQLAACLVHRDDPGVELVLTGGVGFKSAGMAALTMTRVRLGPERILTWTDGL